jgi:hypothetical protein
MATNDPFGDFRRRRGSLFDEFFSEFFDRPLGVEGATSPTGTRTSAPPARRAVEQVDITQVSLAFSPDGRASNRPVCPSSRR